MKIKNILFVEDDEDICQLAEIALVEIGKFHVTFAHNGQEFLSWVKTCDPDLILLDENMPVLKGLDAYKIFKEQFPEYSHVPVIFLTSLIAHQDKQEFLSLGAAGVIEKPYDPLDLMRQVFLCIEQKDSV